MGSADNQFLSETFFSTVKNKRVQEGQPVFIALPCIFNVNVCIGARGHILPTD